MGIVKWKEIFFACICIFAATVPIGVTVLEGFLEIFPLSIIIELGLNAVFVLYVFVNKRILIFKQEKIFLSVLYMPVILSILFIPVSIVTVEQGAYQNMYLTESFIDRVLHSILTINIFLLCCSVLMNQTRDKFFLFIKVYFYSLVFIAIIGFWQWLSYYFGVPFLPIETRNVLHSIDSGVNVINNQRLTSLMREPSFLAPFMVDGLLLTSVIISKSWYKKFFICLFLFIICFSYSLGAYAELFVLLLVYIFFRKKQLINTRLLIGIVVAIGIVGVNTFLEYLLPIIGRLDLIQESARFQMVTMPFIWNMEHSVINTLFGYGPGSYKFLHFTHQLYAGRMVDPTSNNLYVDYLFEAGYVGFVGLIGYCLYILKKSLKTNLFMLLMVSHFILVGFYRAEFVSARFFMQGLIIIFSLENPWDKSIKERTIR